MLSGKFVTIVITGLSKLLIVSTCGGRPSEWWVWYQQVRVSPVSPAWLIQGWFCPAISPDRARSWVLTWLGSLEIWASQYNTRSTGSISITKINPTYQTLYHICRRIDKGFLNTCSGVARSPTQPMVQQYSCHLRHLASLIYICTGTN